MQTKQLADSETNQAQPTMAFDSRQIANHFIRFAKNDHRFVFVTAIMKQVYIAHGWTLALVDRPLIGDRIEAWRYGPVIPAIYYNFRGGQVFFNIDQEMMNDAEESIVQQVYDIYGDMSARQLTSITHAPGGPWDVVTKAQGLIIPDSLIKSYYLEKKRAAEQNDREYAANS